MLTGRVLIGSSTGTRPCNPSSAPGSQSPAPRPPSPVSHLPALLGLPHAPLAFQAMCIPRVFRGPPSPCRLAAHVRRPGRPTHVWTVNDRAERGLWAAGVSGIISDDPAMLAERGGAA